MNEERSSDMGNRICINILIISALIMTGCPTSPTNKKDRAYDCQNRTTVSNNSVISAGNNRWELRTGSSEKMCPVSVTIEYGWANSYRDDDKDRPENIHVMLRANNLIIADPVIDQKMYVKDGKNYWKMSFEKSAAEVSGESPIIYAVQIDYGSLGEPFDEVWVNVKMEHSIYQD